MYTPNGLVCVDNLRFWDKIHVDHLNRKVNMLSRMRQIGLYNTVLSNPGLGDLLYTIVNRDDREAYEQRKNLKAGKKQKLPKTFTRWDFSNLQLVKTK